MSRTTLVGAALVALLPITAVTASAAPVDDAGAGARQAPAYKVTATVNATTVVAEEDTVVVRGRVTPKAARQTVVLQQKLENNPRWRASGKARTKANGTYVLKDTPSTGGERQYRVVKPASRGMRKGVSKALDVTVYAWEKLALRELGANEQIVVGSATVATDYTYPSLVGKTPGTPGYAEYTLGGKCTKLMATYALTDSSATGATGSISVSSDGQTRLSQSLVVGQIVRDHVIELDDVFRIRFDMTSSATPAAHPTIAMPLVLCR